MSDVCYSSKSYVFTLVPIFVICPVLAFILWLNRHRIARFLCRDRVLRMADKDGAKVEDANGEFYPASAGGHELQTSPDMKKDSMYGIPSSMETETTVS